MGKEEPPTLALAQGSALSLPFPVLRMGLSFPWLGDLGVATEAESHSLKKLWAFAWLGACLAEEGDTSWTTV